MAIGIICEYNPFHNGHIYHLQKIKEKYKNEEIVLILSGNYSQRGQISLLEKYDKAEIALTYGINLVVELPYQYSTESSDFFAEGSIKLLNELKCNKIIFGSESNDIEKIKKLANIQLNDKEYDKIVKEELEKGINYPTALSNALKKICNETVSNANDLLAISYVKEIIKNKYNIVPETIKRTNNYNDKEIKGKITSATSIREALKNNKSIKENCPKETLDKIIKYDENKYFEILKYKILSDKNLNKYQTVDEGLDKKILKEINNSNSLEELINNIKSKRYTYNKITRMINHIICSFTKEEKEKYKNINYIRILGFDNKGKKFLNSIKKEITLPIITNINKNNIELLELELRVDKIYNLLTNRNDNLYAKKPIIKQ